MNKPKVLFVYRTPRLSILYAWKNSRGPDSMLFGFNHLRRMGYHVDFFDSGYSFLNIWHWVCILFEKFLITQVGMGFKLDQALHLLPKAPRYDVIVLTGDSAGLPFLWLKKIGLIRQPLILLSSGLAGALFTHPHTWAKKFYASIFPSADLITCYSEVEREYFIQELKLPKNKVHFVPYGTDWKFWSTPSRKKRTVVVAAGVDISRDYKTLFAAVDGLSIRVEVACHPDNIKGLSIPKNVRVRFMLPYLPLRNLFRQATLVIVPLKEVGKSAGQMVVLEAASAKAVLIVSRVRGIAEAFQLRDREHLHYVPPQNPLALRRMIQQLLRESDQRGALGVSASTFVRTHYTTKHLAKNLALFIDEVVKPR